MSDTKQYSVTVECTVTKLVTCENCTEEQARDDPFKYSVDERDLDLCNYRVLKVEADQ